MIIIKHEKDKNRVAAYDDEKEIGEATYSASEKTWIANYTYVDDSYRKKGIAIKLLEKMVEKARENNVKIRPLCSYAVLQAKRHKKEWDDVLAN